MHIKTKYYGHGKLLLSGEYAVLDGALALGLPTKLGQRMSIKRSTSSDLLWESFDVNKKTWFKSSISLFDFSPVETTDEEISTFLQKLLKNCVRQNSEFLSQWNGFKVETELEFPREWGLGTSSSLIYMVAEWAEANPLLLYFKTEDGSGYDVACAFADGPIKYINSEDEVSYTEIDFAPGFHSNIYFVYLEKKQNTAQGIKDYLKAVKNKTSIVKSITQITDDFIQSTSLKQFMDLMEKHEDVIHSHTGFKKAKDLYFKDFKGSIKSLGAWGGDFVMVATDEKYDYVEKYFSQLGYPTVHKYKDLIL